MDKETMIAIMAASLYKHPEINTQFATAANQAARREALEIAEAIWLDAIASEEQP